MSSQAQFQQFGPFFDGGVFVTGAKLYACAAGTTTQKTVWYDQAMTTTAPFPMVANANGLIVGFFDGLYKIVIARASSTGPSDGVLEVWDNYNVSVDGTITATDSTEPRLLFDRFADWINVKDYGAMGDGLTDDTAAIIAALAFGGDNCHVWFPTGIYKVISTITVAYNRVHLEGDGPYATQILFVPSTDDTCLELSAGASILYQGSVSNLAVYSTDATYTKVAIELGDSSGYRLENLVIGGSVPHGGAFYWSGGTGSIGLLTHGREFGQVKMLTAYADKPVVIADNPNSTLDIDHFHFQDLYLGAAGYPCVTIEDGVNLSNVQFDGANAWVGGTHGLYWNDTTTVSVSYNLRIRGLRTEQGEDATAYSIYIAHNANLQNFHLEETLLEGTRRGLYFRKIQNTLIETTQYAGTLEAVNFVGIAGQLLTFQNCFWQVASTATLTGFILYDAMPDYEANKPIPNSAVYVYQTSFQATQRRRLPILATADLPAAGTAQDGFTCIEDAGAGDVNLMIYGRGERHRIDGGANV